MLNENNAVWERHEKKAPPGYEWRFYHTPGKYLFKAKEQGGKLVVFRHINAQSIGAELAHRIEAALHEALADFPAVDKMTFPLWPTESELLTRLGDLPDEWVDHQLERVNNASK